MAHNFLLTVGQDIAIRGTDYLANGVDTGLNVSPNNDTFNAPLAGIFGNQNTFTSGDTIDLTKHNGTLGINNSLFATFASSTEIFASVIGIQKAVVSIVPNPFTMNPFAPSTVTIDGGTTTNSLGASVANFQGLTKIIMRNSSAGSELNFGTDSSPLGALPNIIKIANVPGYNGFSNPGGWSNYQQSGISVIQDAALVGANEAVTIKLINAGSPPTTSLGFSDDYIHGHSESFYINVGPSNGSSSTPGVATWNIVSKGSNNFIDLTTNGSTNATTLNFSGAGNLTVFGDDDEFFNVTTINGSGMTGNLVITGGLNEDQGDHGIIDDDTPGGTGSALTSISGGSGSDFFDLSSLHGTQIAAMTIAGGGGTNTAVFANEVLTGLTAALNMTGIQVVGDGGDFGGGNDPAGTINWALLPGATELKFYHGITWTPGGLVLNNFAATGTVDFQDENFHDNDVTITAANTTATTNALTLIFGSTQTGDSANGVDGHWEVSGYGSINIVVNAYTDLADSGFVATANPGGGITINISGTGDLDFGNTDIGFPWNLNDVGTPSIQTIGGVINDTSSGYLWLGATDASVINASAGGLDMEQPGTWLGAFSVSGSSGSGINNFLQGTLGPLDFGVNANSDSFAGATAALTTMVGGTDAGDVLYTTGGVTLITLHNAGGGDQILYNQFTVDSIHAYESLPTEDGHFGFALAITDDGGNFDFNSHLTTVNNFVVAGSNPGVNDDILSFNQDSWGYGGSNGPGTYLGLVEGDMGHPASPSNNWANEVIVNGSNVFLSNTDNFVLYNQNGATFNQTTLANSLETNAGAIHFAASTAANNTFDMLIAYNTANGVDVADVQFTSDGSTSSAGMGVVVHNLVNLVGVTDQALFNEAIAHHANVFLAS